MYPKARSFISALILFALSSCCPAAPTEAPPVGQGLLLVIEQERLSIQTRLPRGLLRDRQGLGQAVIEAYGNARRWKGEGGRHSGEGVWRLTLLDELRGGTLFDLHLHGRDAPTRSSLYVFVLHLKVPERSDPLSYRILLDREGLRRFNWNRRDFLRGYLDEARLALARDMGYGRTRTIGDLRDFLSPDGWSYELSRFDDSEVMHRGDNRNPDGEKEAGRR